MRRTGSGRCSDEEDEVGGAVGGAEVDLGVQAGEAERGARDRLGTAVRNCDAAGQAGGRLGFARKGCVAQGVGVGCATRVGQHACEAFDDGSFGFAQIGVEEDQILGDDRLIFGGGGHGGS